MANYHPKTGHLAPYHYKPGTSGNPTGGNKPKRLGAVIRQLMASKASSEPGDTVARRFLLHVLAAAVGDPLSDGSTPAMQPNDAIELIRLIWDAHDGPLETPRWPRRRR